jgi:hypothetical protein
LLPVFGGTTVEYRNENGFAERLMRALKEEEIDLSDYDDFKDA